MGKESCGIRRVHLRHAGVQPWHHSRSQECARLRVQGVDDKPAAFVAYGAVGGARAVQNLRMSAATLRMAPISRAVHVSMVELQVLQGARASLKEDDMSNTT